MLHVTVGVDIWWAPDDATTDLDWLMPFAEMYHGANGENWAGVSGSERAKLIAEHGSLWAASQHYAARDRERLVQFDRGAWWLEACRVQIVVIVWFGDAMAGEAEFHASRIAIESDASVEFKQEIERDCVAEACQELELDGFAPSLVYKYLEWEQPEKKSPPPLVPTRPENLLRCFMPDEYVLE